MKTPNKILLESFRVEGSKVFTGRDRGRMVREKSNINTLVNKYDEIIIVIPENVYSINPSFLEEFLSDVVLNLGKDEFNRKVKFESEGNYKIEKSLNEAIERILRKKTALD